jgi:two-component system sensor histidine kinase AlgZ
MDGRSFFQDKRDAGAWQAGCRVEGLLVCIALGTAVAALLAVAPGAPGNRWERFGLFGFFGLWIVLPWYFLVCVFFRPMQIRARFKAGGALALLFVWSLVIGGITHALMQPLALVNESRWAFLQDVGMIGGILTLSLGLVSWQASRLRHWRTRSSAAEVEAWTARLRPHFLFNSLNGITELVATDAPRAEEMIEALARILRASLETGASVPLAQELAVVRDYLKLESMRLEARLRVTWSLPERLPDLAVPTLCLQTLVENAVRHGIGQLAKGGEINIAIATEPSTLIATISNDLAPGQPGTPSPEGCGLGLSSTRARIDALYGKQASLQTWTSDDRFFARLCLPAPTRTA